MENTRDFNVRFTGSAENFGNAARQVTNQLNQVEKSSATAAVAMGAWIGDRIGRAIIRQAEAVIQFARSVTDFSYRLGMAKSEVQKLDYATNVMGGSMTNTANAIRQLEIAQIRALEGENAQAQAFRALGISVDRLRTLRPYELFLAVASAIKDGTQSAEALAEAQVLFGSAGAQVIPMMQRGYADLAEEADRLGMVIKDKNVDALTKSGEAWSKLFAKIRAESAGIMGFLSRTFAQGLANMASVYAGLGTAFMARIHGKGWLESGREGWAALKSMSAAGKISDDTVASGAVTTDAELESFREPKAKSHKAASIPHESSTADHLQRIGLYLSGSPGIDTQRQHLQTSRQILDAIRSEVTPAIRSI